MTILGESWTVDRERADYRTLLAILVLFPLLLACQSPEPAGETPDSRSVDCGPVSPGTDSDGDGIADVIEKSNAELFSLGRCDQDPSRAIGEYHAGSLEGAVNLPDRAPGYEHWLGTDPANADDWADLTLVQCLQSVGRELAGVGVTMHIGDLSKQSGGEFFPHKTHQNGLEIDVHYPRKDGGASPINIWSDQQQYDASATRDLFGIFGRSCDVEVIFAVADLVGFSVDEQGLPSVVDHPQRRSEFLVRLKKPSKRAS